MCDNERPTAMKAHLQLYRSPPQSELWELCVYPEDFKMQTASPDQSVHVQVDRGIKQLAYTLRQIFQDTDYSLN